MFKIFTSKDKSGKTRTQQAKELLKVYGGAYLITSISFAIVSFAICYGLVSRGEPSLPSHFTCAQAAKAEVAETDRNRQNRSRQQNQTQQTEQTCSDRTEIECLMPV